MSYTATISFRTICRLVLFLFTFTTFHPASLRVPWHLDVSFDPTTLTLKLETWNLKLGPLPAYGQSADLAPTPDADSTDPFIVQKAQELGNNAAQIFAFVRDQIGYESYKGSLRGARGTLWSKAGNALDQASLLIALLRASGIPAQYVQGTLSDDLSKQLILSMFPAPLRVVGCPPQGILQADPANDPQLLNETKEHYWVQFGGGNTNADPTFPGATLGQTFASSQGTFTEVPDSLRHKIVVRLQTELAGSFTSQLGLGPDVQTPLNHTFNTVELVGKPLSVGHFVKSNSLGALAFSSTTHVYSPYILIGQGDADLTNDPLIRGTDYQEFFSNFGGFSQFLTGVFLQIDVVSPGGQTQTFERALLDRIGFAARQNGGVVSGSVSATGEPSLNELDLITVNVLPGLQLPEAIGPQRDRAMQLENALNALQPELNAIPSSGPQTDAQRVLVAQAATLTQEIALVTTETTGMAFTAASDRFLKQLQQGYLTKAYYDSPRLTLALTRKEGNALKVMLDLQKNNLRAVPFPGQVANIGVFFEFLRGVMESTLEGEIVSAATGSSATAIADIFGQAQGTPPLAIIAPDTPRDLEGLSLSSEAKARIAQALSAGHAVLTPTQVVTIAGKQTVGWLETDWRTGHTISVMEDGGHQGIVEYITAVHDRLSNPLNAGTVAFIGTIHGWAIAQIEFAGELLSNLLSGGPLEEAVKEAKKKVAERLSEKFIEAVLNVPITPAKLLKAGKDAFGCFNGTLIALDPGNQKDEKFIGITKCLFDLSKKVLGVPDVLPSELKEAYEGGLVAGMGLGLVWIQRNFPGDPPVFPFLSTDLAPGPAPVAPGSQPGVSVQLIPDPLFTVSVGDAQLPSVFKAQIRNTGPVTDTFALTFTGVPSGFSAQNSIPSVIIPPGQTAEIGVCL